MEMRKERKRSAVFVKNNENGGKTIPFPGTKDPNEKKLQNRTAFIIGALTAIIGTVLGTLFVSMIHSGNSYVSNLLAAPKQISELTDTRIPAIEKSLEELKTSTSKSDGDINTKIDKVETKISNVDTRIDALYDIIIKGLDLKATNEYAGQVVEGLGRKTSMDLDTSPVITKMVAISSSGTEFSAEELSGIKLLLPYKDGAKNCYFYGQFNDNNQWDGNCIVNVYSGGILELITDAEYTNGKLVSCKQIFPDYTTRDANGNTEPIWVVSDRTVIEGISYGETWHFFREGDFVKFPEPKDVTTSDILSAEAFKKLITTDMEGYYKGATSNGWFNDDTGNAYMIKYFRNGLIKTLYVGNFHNGLFNDLTENAWMIGKKTESQDAYSYYIGPFKDGIATGGPDCWDEPLERSEIDAYVTQSRVEIRPDLLKWEYPKI